MGYKEEVDLMNWSCEERCYWEVEIISYKEFCKLSNFIVSY